MRRTRPLARRPHATKMNTYEEESQSVRVERLDDGQFDSARAIKRVQRSRCENKHFEDQLWRTVR